MSRQRQVILQELRKLNSHPTADELFPLVRKIIPNISLATVYRNLNWLAYNGVIGRLQYSGIQKRFDGNQEKHYHFICKKCGKAYDVYSDVQIMPVKKLQQHIEHKIDGLNIEFFGICYLCQQQEKKND